MHATLIRPFTALAGACALLVAGPVLAQNQPYYIGVAQSVGHESNLYRIGDSQQLPADLSKSDTVFGTSLVAGVDQTWGRQRLYGSGNLRANRYANNKSLDNESYGLNLAVDWATVGNLSGTVSLAADNSLAQFNNRTATGAIETQKNELRTLQFDTKARLGVVTRYTAEVGAGWRKRGYSAAAYDRYENTQQYVSLGGRFRPSNLLNLGVALRLTHVDYPNWRSAGGTAIEDEQIRRQDIDFTANWQPSGNSQVNLRLSPTRSRYDRNAAADFSGLTGSAGWTWQPTGKTRLTTTLSRDTGQSADAVSLGIFGNGVTDGSRTTTALALKAQHELTGKISLTGGLTYAHRALRSETLLGGVSLGGLSGADNTSILSLGARWYPIRSVQVGCDLSAERRSSSEQRLSVSLHSNSFSCYGQFTLQ
jgi:hypothetical protein